MVSVICPVFNASATIESFLLSMEKQLYGEIEVVLVDDGGQDDAMERAHRLVASRPLAMRVVFAGDGVNRGPGAARNIGMAAATGDYVAFVDSDDWVSDDFLLRLTEAAEVSEADMACGSISLDYPDGHSDVRHNPSVDATTPFTGKAKKRFLLHYKSYFTTYVYRRTFLTEHALAFPPTRSAEDSCFLTCCLLAAERMAQAPDAVYHYVISTSSVSHRRDAARWRNRLASWRTVLRYARRQGLYKPYWGVLRWLYLKKGWLMALRDIVKKS